ncbi:MAG: hypothetical protein V1899_10445 [Planctomycetota bacterium]
MNKLVITCASCGKRYRGNHGSKPFKCGVCDNLLTIPIAPQAPADGRILCSNCWTELDLQEDLTICSACGENIALLIGGKAKMSKACSSSHLASRHSGKQPAANDQTELKKYLISALQERDEAVAAHKKQEKVMSDLMAQLAFSKAAQAATIKDSDEPARWELQMEVGELKSRLESMETQFKNAVHERDKTLAAREEVEEGRRKAEAHIFELEGYLAAEKQARAQETTLKTRVQINPELERKTLQLEQNVITAREERTAAIKERDEAHAKMIQAQSELNRFREAAVMALEPLGSEYNKTMKELITESETLIAKARQQHEEANQRMSQLETLGANLKEHLLMVRREMAQRLSQVLGSPASDSSILPGVTSPPKDNAKTTTA